MKHIYKNQYFPILIFLGISFLITLFPPYESKDGEKIVFDYLFSGSRKYYIYETIKEYRLYPNERLNPQILENAIKYNVTQGVETRKREKAVKQKYPFKTKTTGKLNIDLDKLEWELKNNYEEYSVKYTSYNVTKKEKVYFTGYLSVSKLIMEYCLCFFLSLSYFVFLLIINRNKHKI